MSTFIDAHRGPFRLVVSRPTTKAGFHRTEWLAGTTDRDDVEAEARALLDDPRDTISHVAIWSETEEAFVGVIR
jgi:hypothetical protein